MRGAPGNTINHATSYWVGKHSSRVFTEKVDVVCGIGYDRYTEGDPAFRYHHLHRVVSNLGVFDFGGTDHSMRALSLHPGVTADEVAAKRRRWLVTGSAGFIGSHLLETLLRTGQLMAGKWIAAWIAADATRPWPPVIPDDAKLHLPL